MEDEVGYPRIRNVVLDCANPRESAEFYRLLFGLMYRRGDEPPGEGRPDPKGDDWLVLRNPSGFGLSFQKVENLTPPTWPEATVPQQLHLDTSVPTRRALEAQHRRAIGLGARVLYDRSDDPQEPLRVYADPSGHPFCIFVAPD